MFGLRQDSLLCETWISVNFCHGFEPSCYVINRYMHPVNSLNHLVVIRNSHPYESICYPRVLEMCLGVCASPSCCDHSGAHMGILDASPGYCITKTVTRIPHLSIYVQTFPYFEAHKAAPFSKYHCSQLSSWTFQQGNLEDSCCLTLQSPVLPTSFGE